MKTTTRSRIYLSMAAMIFAASLASPVAAQQQVPFKGTFQGNDAINPPTMTTTGTGLGTLMGAFSMTKTTSFPDLTGPAQWVAANGDRIDSTFVASADVSTRPLGYITITEIHTITGGSGRFAGAQGGFVLERTHIVDPSADGTHVTFGSFRGTITPPGAAE